MMKFTEIKKQLSKEVAKRSQSTFDSLSSSIKTRIVDTISVELELDNTEYWANYIIRYLYQKNRDAFKGKIVMRNFFSLQNFVKYITSDNKLNKYVDIGTLRADGIPTRVKLSDSTWAFISRRKMDSGHAIVNSADNYADIQNMSTIKVRIIGKNAYKELYRMYNYVVCSQIRDEYDVDYLCSGVVTKTHGLRMRRYKKSNFDIILPNDKREKIFGYINNFFELKEKHHSDELIKKLHCGILLFGKPGTGKSTLIKHLAYHLNATIIYIDMTDFPATNGLMKIPDAISSWTTEPFLFYENLISNGKEIKIPNMNVLLVCEDIDLICRKRDTVSKQGFENNKNLHNLLQLFDGFMDDEFRTINGGHVNIFQIATTNDIKALDPALTRPGRFDLQMELPEFDRDIAEKIGAKYGVSASELDNLSFPMTPAELQGEILTRINSKNI